MSRAAPLLALLAAFLGLLAGLTQASTTLTLRAADPQAATYLSEFRDVEQNATDVFRWSLRRGALQLHGFGGQPLILDARLTAPRPGDADPARLTLERSDAAPLPAFRIGGDWRRYQVLLPAGGERVRLRIPTYDAEQSGRGLGVALTELRVRPLTNNQLLAAAQILGPARIGLLAALALALGLLAIRRSSHRVAEGPRVRGGAPHGDGAWREVRGGEPEAAGATAQQAASEIRSWRSSPGTPWAGGARAQHAAPLLALLLAAGSGWLLGTNPLPAAALLHGFGLLYTAIGASALLVLVALPALRPALARAHTGLQRDAVVLGVVVLAALAQGLVYLLLLPPWQHYDEPAHFEYAWMLAFRTLQPTPASIDPIVAQYGGLGRALSHPPAYHLLVALALRPFGALAPLQQLPIARAVSLVLFVLTAAVAVRLLRLLTRPGDPLRWAVPLGVVLLPPFADLMTGVNNDAGAIAAFSVFLLLAARLLIHGRTWRRTLALVLAALMCLAIKNTVAIAVLLVPLVWIVAARAGDVGRGMRGTRTQHAASLRNLGGARAARAGGVAGGAGAGAARAGRGAGADPGGARADPDGAARAGWGAGGAGAGAARAGRGVGAGSDADRGRRTQHAASLRNTLFLAAALLTTMLALVGWGDARGWYRWGETALLGPLRAVVPGAPLGDAALALPRRDGALLRGVSAPLPPRIAEGLAGDTITIGAYLWAEAPTTARIGVIRNDATTEPVTETWPVDVTTTPTWVALHYEVRRGGTMLQFFVDGARVNTDDTLYVDGALLAAGAWPLDSAPTPDADGTAGNWGGERYTNLLANPGFEAASPHLRGYTEWPLQPLLRRSPSQLIASLADPARVVPIITGDVLPWLVFATSGAFGWSDIQLEGAWWTPLFALWIALACAGTVRWLMQTRLAHERGRRMMFVLCGVVLVLLWGNTILRVLPLLRAEPLPFPRYAFAAIIPTMLLLVGGIVRLVPARWRPGAATLVLAGLVVLNTVAWATIRAWFGA